MIALRIPERVSLRLLGLILLMGTLGWAGPLFQIAAVERQGLPPYEDNERLYRLEGRDYRHLSIGSLLEVRRDDDDRSIGLLRVSAIRPGHVLAMLAQPGDTYPMRGDWAVPQNPPPTKKER